MGKQIWLPITETKVTVNNGVVTTWEEMKMTPHPVSNPTGFVNPTEKS